MKHEIVERVQFDQNILTPHEREGGREEGREGLKQSQLFHFVWVMKEATPKHCKVLQVKKVVRATINDAKMSCRFLGFIHLNSPFASIMVALFFDKSLVCKL